ncbi:MAG: hypothetical protein IKF97_05320 [Clostridia bacterium]|nr:hypothetical protein [Clostridia bacterium]
MKNILKIVFVIIGTLIGAGFASGQEMYIFFFSYGINGIFGILISSSLMGFIIYKTLKLINKYNIKNYKDLINITINLPTKNNYFNIKNIINIVINIFILITFFIMIAGFGAYFEQEFNFNHYIGSTILAIMCFCVFMNSVKGLVKINQFLIPILIFLIVIIGIINLKSINFLNLNNLILRTNNSSWFISSILYCSYNSILLVPALITLRDFIKNKKQILIISLISSLIIILLSVILFLLLIKVDINIAELEMPIVYVVSNMFAFLKYLYGFVIVASIFTTSISLGISFLQNVSKTKKSYSQIAVIMCITSVFISQFGFANLVNLLYPIFGYLGIMQILLMISK